jgi:hypothetical protein
VILHRALKNRVNDALDAVDALKEVPSFDVEEDPNIAHNSDVATTDPAAESNTIQGTTMAIYSKCPLTLFSILAQCRIHHR